MVPWVGLQCLTVVYPGHTHLLFVKLLTVIKAKQKAVYLATFFILFCVIIYNLIHLYAIQHSEENIIIVLR